MAENQNEKETPNPQERRVKDCYAERLAWWDGAKSVTDDEMRVADFEADVLGSAVLWLGRLGDAGRGRVLEYLVKRFGVERKYEWKTVRTRDGRNVRVLCTDARGPRPIVGLIENGPETSDAVQSWTASGRYHSGIEWGPHQFDLKNIPPEPVVRWVNVYRQGGDYQLGGILFHSEEGATCGDVQKHDAGYVATVKIEFVPEGK